MDNNNNNKNNSDDTQNNVSTTEEESVVQRDIKEVTSHVDSITTGTQQNVGNIQFEDGQELVQIQKPSLINRIFNYATYKDTSLSSFLSRPILINRYNWNVGVPLSATLSPFYNYFQNSTIQDKLANYSLVRGDLEIIIKVNGSPFHYGRLMIAYTPRILNTPVLDVSNADHKNMVYSQRSPVVYIDPYNNNNVVMKIPYFRPTDYINLEQWTLSAQLTEALTIFDVVTLQTANTGSSTDLSVSVFARMENIEATVITPHIYTAADNKENRDGIISAPANFIANAAGSLKYMPFIGSFMTSTEVVASSIGKIAKVFGFSKPNNNEPLMMMRRFMVDNSANTIGLSAIEKLSYDPQQQIAVSPDATGLDNNHDHLAINHIASRPTIIGIIPWQIADIEARQIGVINVTPMYCIADSYTTNPGLLSMSSLAFASLPFQYWGGSIIYKFSIVCSQYHRGRLRISYVPENDSGVIARNEYNTNYSYIVDIGSTNEFELAIGMSQDTPYRQVLMSASPNIGTTANTAIANTPGNNGQLIISVLNELNAPDLNADVNIIVTARAGPDFTLRGAASTVPNGYISFHSLSGNSTDLFYDTEIFPSSEDKFSGIQEGINSQSTYLVGQPKEQFYIDREVINFGDPVESFRSILKRWNAYEISYRTSATLRAGNNVTYTSVVRPNYPQLRGGPVGGSLTESFQTNSTNFYNPFVNTTMAYLGRAYAAWRGSIRYRYVINQPNVTKEGNEAPDQMYALRRNFPPVASMFDTSAVVADWFVTNTNIMRYGHVLSGFLAGATMSPQQQQPMIEFELPFYSEYKYGNVMSGNAPLNDTNYSADYTQWHEVILSQHNSGLVAGDFNVYSWTAAGDDFSLTWYLGAPQFYYTVVPS